MPNPQDQRNIKDKILNVCKEYPKRKIAMHIQDYSSGQIDMNNHPKQKSVRSYKYRIYEASKKYLLNYLIENDCEFFSKDEIQVMFDEIFKKAKDHINDKSKTYDYPFKDDDTIRKTILILFEECYLSFDDLE